MQRLFLLSPVIVKLGTEADNKSSITSSDSFNLPSARLNKPQGWIWAETPFSAISQIQLEPRVSRSEAASSKRLVRMVPGSARNWIAVKSVQQSILNKKNENNK